MTGFARAVGANARWRWAWEARSVNGRGLDLRLRLPPGFDRLDQPARNAAGKRFQRGSISLNLTLTPIRIEGEVSINRARLDAYVAIAQRLAHASGLAPARIDGLLALRGVIEQAEDAGEMDETATAALDAELLVSLETTLDGLAAARAEEGRRLAAILDELLTTVASLTAQARGLAALQPETLLARLRTQLSEIAGAAPALSPERLAQEAALLAAKADVREELDRLDAHVEQARTLASGAVPAGRKLEFLAQEFNREANTLCSKSSDLELTRCGLELKATIDRLREQAANVE
jgi:uncharacterized protein (TIGR00255 family)